MGRLRLSQKLIALIVGGIFIGYFLIGWLGASAGRRALIAEQGEALEGIRESRQAFIEQYFHFIHEQIRNAARNDHIASTIERLSLAFASTPADLYGDRPVDAAATDQLEQYYEQEFRTRSEAAGLAWPGLAAVFPRTPSAQLLQLRYIANNPKATGSKDRLDAAGATPYDLRHAEIHPDLRAYQQSFGYYDIFLIDPDGNVVYSVFKELDFGTNLEAGPWRSSGLAVAFRKALDLGPGDDPHIEDFAAYAPSYGDPASFAAAPVFRGGKRVGVIAFQMPLDEINKIMTNPAGLGETGETYLVGGDRLLRSNSRHTAEPTVLRQYAEGNFVMRAFAGETGQDRGPGLSGSEVLTSFSPVRLPGLDWAIVAEMRMDEILAGPNALRQRLLLTGVLFAAVLAGGLGWLMRRMVTRPLKRLAQAAGRVREGDYEARVQVESGDELGELAGAFNQMAKAIRDDVQHRERTARELADAREAAESANRAKSAFLANMSHELRTPMNAIIGYSEMLVEELESDAATEDFVPDVRRIHASGHHLLSLINDILDLSKIESGRMDLYLERFSLAEMLDDAAATVQPLMAKNGNRLELDVATDIGPVRADQTKLRQAVFNLLSNAAKFTEQGVVGLTARQVSGTPGEERIQISVSDSGIGIPDDKLEHVFDEFTQADSSTTRTYGGTGLGLPITRRFCRMMGGDVTVTSKAGEGSVFMIELPARVDALAAARGDQAVERGESTVEPDAANPVLVIDDDGDARELLRRALEGEGYAVVTAACGEEGLAVARSVLPRAITLDVMMPELDGWEVLRRLKADPALRDIPVILVTIVSDRNTGFALGAADYLTKPVDRSALLHSLRRLAPANGSGKALVVEDDPDTRDIVARTLASEGWQVSEAENGRAGLDAFAAGPPDLVITDLMMPVMDGFEFMSHLRTHADGLAVPVIVLTAKDLSPEERHFLEAQAATIIAKGDHDTEALLAEVRRQLTATPETPG